MADAIRLVDYFYIELRSTRMPETPFRPMHDVPARLPSLLFWCYSDGRDKEGRAMVKPGEGDPAAVKTMAVCGEP